MHSRHRELSMYSRYGRHSRHNTARRGKVGYLAGLDEVMIVLMYGLSDLVSTVSIHCCQISSKLVNAFLCHALSGTHAVPQCLCTVLIAAAVPPVSSCCCCSCCSCMHEVPNAHAAAHTGISCCCCGTHIMFLLLLLLHELACYWCRHVQIVDMCRIAIMQAMPRLALGFTAKQGRQHLAYKFPADMCLPAGRSHHLASGRAAGLDPQCQICALLQFHKAQDSLSACSVQWPCAHQAVLTAVCPYMVGILLCSIKHRSWTRSSLNIYLLRFACSASFSRRSHQARALHSS